MRAFADLYEELDATTGTNAKVAAMAQYFRAAPPEDAAWALYFLTGRRLKRFLSSKLLREWVLERTGLAEWLFDESYESVGDTAETCALLMDSIPRPLEGAREAQLTESLAVWMEEKIRPLARLSEIEQKERVQAWWAALPRHEIFVLNKLLTGAFRVGVSQSLVSRALAEVSGHALAEISHRLMGDWEPTAEWYARLVSVEESNRSISQPYPFYLASPLEKEIETLGASSEWLAEWKWDGIRAQLIRRGSKVFIWSRGEELITDRFPELAQAALTLPDGTVLDGEILAVTAPSETEREGYRVLPFSVLQKRIGRKTLSASILREAPAGLMVYDLLEDGGQDLRSLPLQERRARLEARLTSASKAFRLSPSVPFSDWTALAVTREESRARSVEGIMLKRLSSVYQAGRKRGDWWKWKIDPLTIDAVLLYAQPGTGRRANLFTDYTFALWDGDQLVPVAKAYSGLKDDEIATLDSWIRRNTRERFGPVRSLNPVHVFELAFEGINASPRHKSGVAVRFPRILRWRHDKKIDDADTLDNLKALIDPRSPNGQKPDSPQYDLAADPSTEEA